jgi:hypothetical protein
VVLLGSLKCRSLRSTSIFLAGASAGGGKRLRHLERSGVVGQGGCSEEEKGEGFCEAGGCGEFNRMSELEPFR